MSSVGDGVTDNAQVRDVQSASAHKSSIKRKFEGSETDVKVAQSSQSDGFEYQRREPNGATRRVPSRFTPRPADRVPQTAVSAELVSPRKALAPKSTNSPTKRVAAISLMKAEAPEYTDIVPAQLPARRAAAPNPISSRGIEASQTWGIETENLDTRHAPKTPAPSLEDIISPPLSAIDTAPKLKSIEAAITNSVEDVLSGSIGRGSRRAKAAVSYAEPNLRDKMRRPDKKLVGAVEGFNKLGTASEKEPGRERSLELPNGPTGTRTALIKSETESGEDIETRWETMPQNEATEEAASPLQERQKPAIAVSSETRKKRTHSESEGTRSARNRSMADAHGELDKAVSRLSIFDPPDSSPVSSSTENKQSVSGRDKASSTTARTSRIAPEIPSTTTTRTRRFSVQPASDPAPPATTTRTSDKSLARSSSVMSMRDTGGKENINNLATTSKLKRASSVQAMNNGGSGAGGVETRTVGTRRRSMMV